MASSLVRAVGSSRSFGRLLATTSRHRSAVTLLSRSLSSSRSHADDGREYNEHGESARWSSSVRLLGAALAGAASLVLFCRAHQAQEQPAAAVKPSATTKDIDWRERVAGNYANRIRSLSSPEKIFGTFASVTKDGEKFMTLSDFVNAVLPYDYNPSSERGELSAPEFFKMADIDGDGLISFAEYAFFITLLGIPQRYFKVAFRMFDKDSSGTIDFDEFKGVMEVVRSQSPMLAMARDPKAKEINESMWFSLFFGRDAKQQQQREISFERFSQVIASLQHGVRELEFYRHDPNRTGYISLRSFAMTLVGFAPHKDVPAYVHRADSLANRPETVSLEEFFSFSQVIEHIEDIALALRLFTTHKQDFHKDEFARAVKAVTHISLSQPMIDTIFAVFDSDGDGTLNERELVDALRKRKDLSLGEHRDTGFLRLFKCAQNCLTKGDE